MQLSKKKLEEWTSKIGVRIYIIKNSRKQYNKFLEKYKNKKLKNLDSDILWWIDNNYKYTLILLMAGLLEGSNQKDDLNFQKFLRQVKEYGLDKLKQDLIADKPKYFSDFNNIILEELEDNDSLEIERKKIIEEKYFKNINIEQDIKTLNDNFLLLKTLRDKHYAHFTDSKNIKIISDEKLDEIINQTTEIFDKYSFIVKNTTYIFD